MTDRTHGPVGRPPDRPGPPHPVVRVASPSDVLAVSRLYRLQAEFHASLEKDTRLTPDYDWRPLVDELIRRRDARLLVSEVSELGVGDVVGFLHARLVGVGLAAPTTTTPSQRIRALLRSLTRRPRPPRLHDAVQPLSYGVIQDVFVTPERRTEGHGRGLVAAACEWFKSHGLDRVLLDVATDNADGVRFWESLGFIPVRQRMRLELH